MAYKKVLVAYDLNDPAESLNQAVKDFLANDADVHLCTAVIPIELMYSFVPIGGYSIPITGLQDELIENAQKGLSRLADQLGVEAGNAHLLVGKAATEIKAFAEENNFEVIIIGTHGKGAIRSALGSTSNGVLHGAPCDVLAVNVG
jgi:universal stress protein A